jgi:curved DNA-binding protein CbpA
MRTHYDTLGIPKEASMDWIKRSYRSLVKTHHPDKFADGSVAKAEAEERLREINAAYAVLAKPLNRATYDAKLTTRRAPPPREPEPEHCARCGRPTTYWHAPKKVALCHVCAGIVA